MQISVGHLPEWIQSKDSIPNVEEAEEQLELSHLAGMHNGTATFENSWQFPRKLDVCLL